MKPEPRATGDLTRTTPEHSLSTEIPGKDFQTSAATRFAQDIRDAEATPLHPPAQRS